MGSTGGGGGGSASGKIDYPKYVKFIHADWCAGIADAGDNSNLTGRTRIESNVTTVMNTALGGSPYTNLSAYDPATYLSTMASAVSTFAGYSVATLLAAYDKTVVAAAESPIAPLTDFNANVVSIAAQMDTTLFGTTVVNADISAYGDLLSDELETNVLPRFRRGMQDINAVQSSSFVIGAAILETARLREVSKYGTDLRVKNQLQKAVLVTQSATNVLQLKAQIMQVDLEIASKVTFGELEYRKAIAATTIENSRLSIVAKKEQTETDAELDDRHAKWDLEVFQYGANVLASAVGGTVQHPSASKTNKWQTALGGVMAGAGVGASLTGGNPVGAVIGAVVGGLGGLLSGD